MSISEEYIKYLRIIESENLVENSRMMGQEMLKGFQWLQQEIDIVGEVRGLGLVGAIEIVKDKATGERFESPLSPKIVAEAANRGLICRCVTFEGSDTLVFAPPLVITKEEIDKMIHILHESFVATQVKN